MHVNLFNATWINSKYDQINVVFFIFLESLFNATWVNSKYENINVEFFFEIQDETGGKNFYSKNLEKS